MNHIQAQHEHPLLTGRLSEEVCSSPACTEHNGARLLVVGICQARCLALVRWPSKSVVLGPTPASVAYSAYSFRNEPSS